MNNFQNPYNYNPYSFNRPPTYEVIKVNGKPGVDAFQMGPNSSILLLDETANLVWLAQTDGAGYKTATPFTITPFVEKPPVDMNALTEKIDSIEAELKELREMYAKPDTSSTTPKQRGESKSRQQQQ